MMTLQNPGIFFGAFNVVLANLGVNDVNGTLFHDVEERLIDAANAVQWRPDAIMQEFVRRALPSEPGGRFADLMGPAEIRGVKLALAAAAMYHDPGVVNYDGFTAGELAIVRRATRCTMVRGCALSRANLVPQSPKAGPRFPAPAELRSVVRRGRLHVVEAAARGAKRALAMATTTVPLRSLDEFEAPVHCLLATPDGGRIAIRRLGSTWLRPVLAPERFEPITIGEFLSAMASGPAWRDCPSRTIDVGCRGLRNFGEYGSMLAMRDIASRIEPGNRTERQRMASCETAVRRSFDELFRIGDGVWKVANEPRICLSGSRDDGLCTWRVGDLHAPRPRTFCALEGPYI